MAREEEDRANGLSARAGTGTPRIATETGAVDLGTVLGIVPGTVSGAVRETVHETCLGTVGGSV